jgi:hypothetical protein
MNIRSTLVRFSAVVILMLMPLVTSAQELVSPFASLESLRQPMPDHGAYIVREIEGKVFCSDATPIEARAINARPDVPLRVFGERADRVRANASAGLNIILRGTAQLDANPAAKAAFERAADIWESRIANPVTVYVDVDFGSTRFGQAWADENIIASASSDYRGGSDGLYAGIRPLLVARADNATETSVYGALPASSLPTDLGSTTRLASPSILLRALGAIDATAQPTDSGPQIGFNSAFTYDFDPSNGISFGAKDFEGVVVHEIGHMLGFTSLVGVSENGSSSQFTPTILDFFRFRPGVTSGSFGSAQRIQSSGGEQVYFANGAALGLSTGRPDGTGGDEQQASHWKDDALTGVRIGIMDPTLGSGERTELTSNDLQAFGMIGYNIVTPSAGCDAEPNDNTTTASPLTLGTPCTGSAATGDSSGIIVRYNDGTEDPIEDVFRVTLPSSARLNVSLSFGSGDLDVFLFTVSGSTVTILDSSNGSTSPETFLTDNPLSAGTYYIGVSAFSGSSSYTLTATAEGLATVPAAPSNLIATPLDANRIQLTWTDNSNNETEFVVEVKVNGTFVALSPNAGANSTGANVSGFQAGQTATFRVKARNAAGDSGYSNEASATTPGSSGPCVPNATTVCLLSDRFRVSIAFVNQFANPPAPGNFLGAKLIAGVQNPDVATFGISAGLAVEVVVRIQDTRPFGLNRFDVYYAGLTDLEYTITVTDTQKGTTKTYRNPPGSTLAGFDRTTFTAN